MFLLCGAVAFDTAIQEQRADRPFEEIDRAFRGLRSSMTGGHEQPRDEGQATGRHRAVHGGNPAGVWEGDQGKGG